MPDALLTTKLHIPQAAPEFVPRPHLTARLDEGLRRKLTLVSAPAEFGKSTLRTYAERWTVMPHPPIARRSLGQRPRLTCAHTGSRV